MEEDRGCRAGPGGAGCLRGDGWAWRVGGWGRLRGGARGLCAGPAGGGGASVELGQVGGGAALPGGVVGWGRQAEVAADFGDDVGDGAGGEVRVEVGAVEAVVQLGGEGFGAVAFVGGAVDAVLDGADDLCAGGGAVVGRVGHGSDGVVEVAGEGDAAPDGTGDTVKGGGDFWGGGGCLACGWPGWGWGGGLGVQGAGEVGGHADDVVEDLAVVLRVLGVLAGVGGWIGVGWLGGHEQKKNIVGVGASRVV